MMKKCGVKSHLLVSIIFLAVPITASADGNTLLQQCNQAVRLAETTRLNQSDSLDATYCMAYVEGVVHTHFVYQTLGKKKDLEFCVPESGIRIIQPVRIIVKYLEEHPEQLNLQEYWLVIGALGDAFPCPDDTD